MSEGATTPTAIAAAGKATSQEDSEVRTPSRAVRATGVGREGPREDLRQERILSTACPGRFRWFAMWEGRTLNGCTLFVTVRIESRGCARSGCEWLCEVSS